MNGINGEKKWERTGKNGIMWEELKMIFKKALKNE